MFVTLSLKCRDQRRKHFIPLQDQWEITLLVDGFILTSLDGIPELSTSTQLVFHVWNEKNAIAPLPDLFDPPFTIAYFRNLRFVDLL